MSSNSIFSPNTEASKSNPPTGATSSAPPQPQATSPVADPSTRPVSTDSNVDNGRHWARDQTKASLLDFPDEILTMIAQDHDWQDAISLSLASSRLYKRIIDPADSSYWYKAGKFAERLQGLKPEWGGHLPLVQPETVSRDPVTPESEANELKDSDYFPGGKFRHVPLPEGITRAAILKSYQTSPDNKLIDYKTLITETMAGNVGQSCQVCLRQPLVNITACDPQAHPGQGFYYPPEHTQEPDMPSFTNTQAENILFTYYYPAWNLRLCNPCANANVFRKSILEGVKLDIDFDQLPTQEAFYPPANKWCTDCIWMPKLINLIGKRYGRQVEMVFTSVFSGAGECTTVELSNRLEKIQL